MLGLAVLFDYINGFHDTANAIATSVSTRALRPERAILMSATANFLGALTGTAVAKTIGVGHRPRRPTPTMTSSPRRWSAASSGTWSRGASGMPSSEQPRPDRRPARRGPIAAGGPGAINVDGVVSKVLIPLVTSPILGLVIGFAVDGRDPAERVPARQPARINDRFRRLQVVSAAFMAFSHGSNDAQKTMGIMTLALITAGVLPRDIPIPLWVIVLAATAISLGTAAGGWRIIKTMGQKVVKLDPVHGFAAETTAATIIFGRVAFRDARLDDARHLERDHGRRRRATGCRRCAGAWPATS